MRKFLFLFLQNKLSPDVSLSLKPNSLHLQGFLDPNRTSGSVLEITFADGCSYVGIYVCVRVRVHVYMCVFICMRIYVCVYIHIYTYI